jgi:hypothetical protein
MNQEMGLTEFFAMEAGEYLERLDTLVSGAVGPDRDELVRLTRALRGSALMANQQPIGSVAAALESVARAVKEERIAWEEATRQTVIRTIDGLKILVRSVGNWGDAETSRANRLAEELTAATGLGASEPTAPSEPTVDTGTRAFVAREGAAVASVLDQTAKALQREGPSESHIETVIRSMEPLRGLAALSELSPLPEYLDGVEQAMVVVARSVDQPNELALFLDVAARGLSKAAQEISTAGSAEAESVEAREFTRRLAEILNVDGEVVPIQSLYYEDDGPHVLESGSPPTIPGEIGQMEFVAQGEHLCQLADGLERAEGNTQREIRTISLKGTLRTLIATRGSSLASAVSAFSSVALAALAGGILESSKAGFLSCLRQAGGILGTTTPANGQAPVADLTGVTEALRTLHETGSLPVTEPVEAADGPISRPMAPSAAVSFTEPDPEPEAEPVEELELEPLPSGAAEETVDIAVGWATYESLRSKLGEGEPSIGELIGGGPVEEELVSIATLCYSGPAALIEAHNVRERIRSELAESEWDAALITELVDELLDLVELGVGQA